jgi:hypothetical protein
MKTHQCKQMKNDHFPNGQQSNYSYKWTGDEAGWKLFSNDKPVAGQWYSWVCNCNWCNEAFEVIDTVPVIDPHRVHRCNKIIRCEWKMRQAGGKMRQAGGFTMNDDDEMTPSQAGGVTTNLLGLIWDGYAWNMHDGEEVTSRMVSYCQYCDKAMPDPRLFRNKVEII